MDLEEKVYLENKVTIISQNLYNYRNKNIKGKGQVAFYMQNYKADLYAFQEFPEWGRGKTFHTSFYDVKGEAQGDISEVKNIWNNYFPWTDFPRRYWSELLLTFDNQKVRIINVHIGSGVDDQLRMVLLERIEQLSGEHVLLVGDFNAAFLYQTEHKIQGNDVFLSKILDKGYTELKAEEENKEPHYTYAFFNKKSNVWERKKFDHIFYSKTMEDMEWKLSIEYIDEVNINLNHINNQEPENPFTDHSGLKVVIEVKNP